MGPVVISFLGIRSPTCDLTPAAAAAAREPPLRCEPRGYVLQELEAAFRLFDWKAYNERFDVSIDALRAVCTSYRSRWSNCKVWAACGQAFVTPAPPPRTLRSLQVPWGAKEAIGGMVAWGAAFVGVGLLFIPVVRSMAGPEGFSGLTAGDKSTFALANQVWQAAHGACVLCTCPALPRSARRPCSCLPTIVALGSPALGPAMPRRVSSYVILWPLAACRWWRRR